MITDCPQVDLMKIAFSGIKYICSWRDIKRESERIKTRNQQSLEDTQNTLQLIDLIFMFCGCLTLRNFVITFPIEKKYDGAKCGWKDYFYTMDILSKMDWDKPIGRDELSELLWDYENTHMLNLLLLRVQFIVRRLGKVSQRNFVRIMELLHIQLTMKREL